MHSIRVCIHFSEFDYSRFTICALYNMHENKSATQRLHYSNEHRLRVINTDVTVFVFPIHPRPRHFTTHVAHEVRKSPQMICLCCCLSNTGVSSRTNQKAEQRRDGVCFSPTRNVDCFETLSFSICTWLWKSSIRDMGCSDAHSSWYFPGGCCLRIL